jgi:cardiolipin synthase
MKSYLGADEIRLVHSGAHYFRVLEQIIDEAQTCIQFQTYIFDEDNTGKRIIDALKRAAVRGVEIYVMIDAFGSTGFSNAHIKELNKANFHIRKFSRLFSNESVFFGRRLHWKIIIADKSVALTGGINIADKYNDGSAENAWLDYAVLIKGSCCGYLHLLCEANYKKRSLRQLELWQRDQNLPKQTDLHIGFRINDWIKQKNEIYLGYLNAIQKAKKQITIVSSYFLPGYFFRRALTRASARGVQVNIILAGKSDVGTVRSAEIYLYDFYVKNKFNIYEWENSVMHGKAMVVDDHWATVGSYNINFLSRFISVELNIEIEDRLFVNELSSHLKEVIQTGCKKIETHTIQKRSNVYFRLKIWLAYNFYRLIMNIFVRERDQRKK